MSESKETAAGSDEQFLRSRPAVEVTGVEVTPNPAALADELNLEVDFHVDRPVLNGVWDIEYLVDSVTKRHVIKLGQVPPKDYARGDNHFQFSVSEISVSGIQPSQLTNCGLLTAAFKDDDGDILDLKMVVQVSEQRDGLQRIVYNPLE